MHSFRVCTNGLHSVCRQALLTEFVIVLIADFFLAQNASQIACFIPCRATTTWSGAGGELQNDSFVRRPLRPIAIFRAAEPTIYALPSSTHSRYVVVATHAVTLRGQSTNGGHEGSAKKRTPGCVNAAGKTSPFFSLGNCTADEEHRIPTDIARGTVPLNTF